MTIDKAFRFAYQVHQDQVRKDGKPYISHPVNVAMELARNGADEDLICAGFLHDTLEDTEVDEAWLLREFNENIVQLIQKESEDKSKSWEERKEKVLADTAAGDRRLKMLVCADKLSNLRDVEEDIEKNGDEIWSRFKRGKDQQEWFYRNLLVALEEVEDTQMYQDFEKLVSQVFGEGGTT